MRVWQCIRLQYPIRYCNSRQKTNTADQKQSVFWAQKTTAKTTCNKNAAYTIHEGGNVLDQYKKEQVPPRSEVELNREVWLPLIVNPNNAEKTSLVLKQ